jgi:hypothetical protein
MTHVSDPDASATRLAVIAEAEVGRNRCARVEPDRQLTEICEMIEKFEVPLPDEGSDSEVVEVDFGKPSAVSIQNITQFREGKIEERPTDRKIQWKKR